jgi:2'-phosphotransferase
MADSLDDEGSGSMAHLSIEDKVHRQADLKASGSGGRRGGKGRGGGQGRDVQISKTLSRLLRHQADNAGIALDEGGFAQLDKVVSSI